VVGEFLFLKVNARDPSVCMHDIFRDVLCGDVRKEAVSDELVCCGSEYEKITIKTRGEFRQLCKLLRVTLNKGE
jgi:hypothetical protein